jgi:RNA polymerase sigma factor (sigma-70 family)
MRQAVIEALRPTDSSPEDQGSEPSDADLLLRFAAERDEAAFEAIVKRHGPMVQGVCRRILGQAHTAEDAFQAVFLVLVRKSASIRRPELMANWLYGVACRIAQKARSAARRNEFRERQARTMPQADRHLDFEWAELKAVLDEELSQLPEKYRAPLVLCYLCGQTNAQAAAQLGWPIGSISERLARAREMLRKRLNKRGLTLSGGIFALLLLQKAGSAAVSPLLVQATTKTALVYASNAKAAAALAPGAAELAGFATQFTIGGYLKTVSIALFVALVIFFLWPQRGFSAKSLWFARDAASPGDENLPAMAPADAAGNGREAFVRVGRVMVPAPGTTVKKCPPPNR